MDIRGVLDRWVTLQAGLTITSPVAAAIKRAYKIPPPRASALPDTPCWINSVTMPPLEPYAGRRFEHYTINSQLFVTDADLNRGADIALAFLAALNAAQTLDFTLSGDVIACNLRGGDPTLALLDWAGQGHPGLDLYLDLEFENTTP